MPLEPLPKADAGFFVTFGYDFDGILQVKAQHQKTGRLILDEQLSFGAAGSTADPLRMRRRIDGLTWPTANGSAGPSAAGRALSEESRVALERARTKIIPDVDAATQTRLGDLIDALEASDDEDEAQARRASRSASTATCASGCGPYPKTGSRS